MNHRRKRLALPWEALDPTIGQGGATLENLMTPPRHKKKGRSARICTSPFFQTVEVILVGLPGQSLIDGDLGDGLGDGIGDLGVEG